LKPLLRKLGILWGVLAIVVGSLAMWGGGVASAAPAVKYPICHRTASDNHPYVYIEVAASSIDGDTSNDNGQGDHLAEHTGPVYPAVGPDGKWGDIIPPVQGVTPGSANWTEGGQAVFENGCQIPGEELWSTTVSTVVFNAATDEAVTGAEVAGASVYDTSSVGDDQEGYVPTGTISYRFWSNNDCGVEEDSSGTDAGTVDLGTKSSTQGPLAAGSYSFKATYGGDKNFAGSTSGCEPFAVLKAASPSPSPSASPSPSPSPSASPSPSPSPSASPSPSPSPSASATPTPSPTETGGVLAEVSTVPNASTDRPTGGSNPALPIGMVLLIGLAASAFLIYRSRIQR